MPQRSTDPHRELFVLGLLRRAPFAAYAIDRAMREHVPLYRRFSRGNIYQFVERLAEKGLLVRRIGNTRRGPRDKKWIYTLAPAGEARFRELLRNVMMDVQSSDVALETAVVLLGQLSRDEALQLVEGRAEEVQRYERRLTRIYGPAERSGAGALSRLRVMHRLRGERRYLDEVAALLRDRKWEPEWVLDDGPIGASSRKL